MRNSIVSEKLKKFNEIELVISNKAFGNQNFQNHNTSEKETINNRDRFFNKSKINIKSVINVKLENGNKVFVARKGDEKNGAGDRNSQIKTYDGLITNDKNLYLMITIADCFPIFFYDKKRRVIGLAHAGWRGIVKNIIVNILESMNKNFKSNMEDIIIFIGPGIQKCHFEIKKDILKHFSEFENAILEKEENIFVDLPIIIKKQLIANGILEKNIEISNVCTYCDESNYSSFRRDKKDFIAQAAVIGMI